ncbi:MFS transporter [uncultured Amnibacterium sp.]|uniref:MFS transporter n=1 Tax=uncultured Amnibacterium sp. TaxID=1631851 RepID=UPI0035C9BD4F
MTSTAPAPGGITIEPRRAWLAFVVLLIGISMSLLDATIVNVALPTIRTSLNASESTLSWVVSGYSLAFGLVLIPAGRLGDKYGHKWVFFGGLAGFTAASVACGLAQSDAQLIVARVVQGLAAGMYLPAVNAYIQLLFQGRVRGRAFAILGAVIGVASALGPLVGGLLIQAFGEKNGWRLVFGVNLPIGLVALIGCVVLVPNRVGDLRRTTGGFDVIGLVIVAAGLSAILVPLIEGQDQSWPAWTFVTLIAGVAFLVAFAIWERSVARRQGSPLVPPHLYSHAAFTGGTILALVYFAAFTSIFFTLSLLWQAGLGHSALETGLLSLPFAIGSILGASQSSRLAAMIGRRVLIIGTACVSLGLIGLWLVLQLVPTADLTTWALLGPLALGGIGSGLFIAPNVQFITATVDPAEAGAASGVISTMQRLGSAIGIAVISSTLFGALPVFHGRPTPAQLADGFGTAAAAALAVSAGFAILSFLLVFALPRRVAQRGGPAQRPAEQAEPVGA